MASIALVVFVFLTISAFLPKRDPHAQSDVRAADDPRNPRTNREKFFSFVGWRQDKTQTTPSTTVSPKSPRPIPHKPFSENGLAPASHHLSFDPDFRLLIGVMSPSWSSARRQIIRDAYLQFPKNIPVDVVFVQADTESNNDKNYDRVRDMYQRALRWENNTCHDLMHLNCTENLEEGKTYEYLKKVGREFSTKYTHVMKTDDDSFINIPGTTNGSRF
jgi:hypothetical protein